jgi:hypothetical protein
MAGVIGPTYDRAASEKLFKRHLNLTDLERRRLLAARPVFVMSDLCRSCGGKIYVKFAGMLVFACNFDTMKSFNCKAPSVNGKGCVRGGIEAKDRAHAVRA